MTIPTAQEIRAMDGEALTRLAYTLGLAPNDVQYVDDRKPGWWRGETYQGLFMPLKRWHPHDDLFQAREVFLERLPALGFVVNWYAVENFGRISAKLCVTCYSAEVSRASAQECLWGIGEPGNPAEPSPAMAALRCACLARAAQLREEAQNHE